MTATRSQRRAPLEAGPTEVAPPAAPPRDDGDRFTRETAKLRTKKSIPVDRWFQLAGAALLGIGILAIIGGWYGVAHTAREWRQTPYVVSGGILGLALVFTGGVGYLAFWLTRLVEQSQRQAAVLERIEEALTGGPAPTEDTEVLLAPPGILHRPSCPLIAGRTDLTVPDGERGLRTCPVCDPPQP